MTKSTLISAKIIKKLEQDLVSSVREGIKDLSLVAKFVVLDNCRTELNGFTDEMFKKLARELILESEDTL